MILTSKSFHSSSVLSNTIGILYKSINGFITLTHLANPFLSNLSLKILQRKLYLREIKSNNANETYLQIGVYLKKSKSIRQLVCTPTIFTISLSPCVVSPKQMESVLSVSNLEFATSLILVTDDKQFPHSKCVLSFL